MTLELLLDKALNLRKEKNQFRELKVSSGLVDFCSNDYLGLARSEKLYHLINERIDALDLKTNGATGSRLLSGNDAYTTSVEKKLAFIFKCEATLILNSGYTANLAVLSSIPQRGDTILFDEFAHASMKDGARLSLATRFSFKHNDLFDLESKLKRSKGKAFIAIESIYSMHGDECPLQDIISLSKKYNAAIFLDEAHSTGVMGSNGSGLATSLGLESDIDIRLYTFGKAMGIHGACIAGSEKLIAYIVNFARPFIYTTAMTPHSIIAIECAFDYLNENKHLPSELQDNVDLFIGHTQNCSTSKSSIQTIVFPGNDNVKNAASSLQIAGLDVRPILSPTVPVGFERLRICLHTFNTREDIVKLTEVVKKL